VVQRRPGGLRSKQQQQKFKNARNLLWNSRGSDSSGNDLEALSIQHKLNIVNRPREDLPFIPGGTTFADATFAGDLTRISRWMYLAMPSLSDHPYFYLKVPFEELAPLLVNKAPSLDRINKEAYLTNQSLSLANFEPLLAHKLLCESVEHNIERLSSAIVSCARHAKTKGTHVVISKIMTWWSSDLCALRSKARASF
jgi:hypothetical protein